MISPAFTGAPLKRTTPFLSFVSIYPFLRTASKVLHGELLEPEFSIFPETGST